MRTGIKLAVCGALCVLALTLGAYTLSDIAVPAQVTVQKASVSAGDKYLLGEKDGSVVVYGVSDTTTPLIVTNISSEQLREKDRELLREGIPAAGEEELAKLLEDLGS